MELYIDGILNAFKAFSGAILTSTKPFTIGRMDNLETLYSLRGSVDEVKLWDRKIPVKQVEQLKNEWATPAEADTLADPIERIWPNPAQKALNVEFTGKIDIENIALFAEDGRKVLEYQPERNVSSITNEIPPTFSGLYLLRIILKDGRVAVRKIVIRR